MNRNIVLLALGLALYASILSTYLLVDGYIESENKRIMKMCKDQRMVPYFECLKR